jgi:tetratricopeptide (TPR) repeat protein
VEEKMRDKLAIGCIVLAATCRVAAADDLVDKCRFDMPICNEIIASPSSGPDAKAVAYRYRGELRTDAGENRLAIADFSESIRLKMDDASAFAGRGRAKFSDKNLGGSIADYSEAIRLSPRSADFYVQRGHVEIVSKQLDAAIGDLTAAIRLNPSSAQALNTRGAAYASKRDFDSAINDYTAAIALFPFPAIYANRGYAYEAEGRSHEAIDDLQYALLHDPSQVGARDGLKRLGAPADAITSQTGERVREGALLAEKSCSGCHAVGVTGVSPNRKATEFRNYYQQQQIFELRQPITRALRETHDPMQNEHLQNLSDKELDSIVAYINSLSTVKRLGSPG